MLDWLIANRGDSNYTLWDTHPKLSTIQETTVPNFTFTVVRNPWDRMISMYHYMKNIAINQGSQWIKLNNITKDNFPTFEEWLLSIEERIIPTDYWFKGTTCQMAWIDKPVDLVIRYENLSEEFIKIQDVFNCSIPLPHLYSSGRSNYKDYYTTTSKKFVEQFSLPDIETWKYQF
jgi:hypothetical protein